MKKISLSKLFQRKKSDEPVLPKVTHPYDLEVKRQQKRFLLSFVLLLLFAGVYTYGYVREIQRTQQPKKVYVASQDITAPAKAQESQLLLREFPRKTLPRDTISDWKDLKGKTFLRDVAKNEIITMRDVQDRIDASSISAKFSEFFALAMDEYWFESKLPEIKKNDLIDVLVSNPTQGLASTTTVASGIKVIDVAKFGPMRTLFVNVSTEEAEAILFARGLRLPMQVLVHPSLKPPSLPAASETEEEVGAPTAAPASATPPEITSSIPTASSIIPNPPSSVVPLPPQAPPTSIDLRNRFRSGTR